MKTCGKYHVRLDDGTCWYIDGGMYAENMNWLLRYGREEDVLRHRLTIASMLSTLDALVWATQKRRNEVCAALRAASSGGADE